VQHDHPAPPIPAGVERDLGIGKVCVDYLLYGMLTVIAIHVDHHCPALCALNLDHLPQGLVYTAGMMTASACPLLSRRAAFVVMASELYLGQRLCRSSATTIVSPSSDTSDAFKCYREMQRHRSLAFCFRHHTCALIINTPKILPYLHYEHGCKFTLARFQHCKMHTVNQKIV
jgi:hypothetical protein